MMDMKRIYNILLIMILSLFLLPLGGCFDSDINRSMYEADGEEMQRENHIVGATLKGMQGLVIPTREHLYQFMDAMAGGAYGGYLEGIVDTWVMKFSTFNPEQGWLKSPFAAVCFPDSCVHYGLHGRSHFGSYSIAGNIRYGRHIGYQQRTICLHGYFAHFFILHLRQNRHGTRLSAVHYRYVALQNFLSFRLRDEE